MRYPVLNRPARMRDVAEVAGVGTMTVSRVLNGNVKVSDETRARVLNAIAKLNYQPNEIARSLRDHRSRQVGIIVPNLRDPFFAICSHCISMVAQQHDYSVILTTSNEDPETEYVEATRMLRRHIDGLIVIPALGPSRLRERDFGEISIVALDRPIPSSAYDCVLVENQSGACLGVQHLLDHGHRHIAYFGLARAAYTIKARVDGYREAMQQAGLRPSIHLVGDSLPEILTTVVSLLSGKRQPTAFFCSNNLVTRNVLHALSTLNVKIPGDIALVGFDDFEMADIIKPAVTVVRQPVELLGRTAADLLFSRLEDSRQGRRKKEEAGQRIVLPTELVVRDSCGTHEKAFPLRAAAASTTARPSLQPATAAV